MPQADLVSNHPHRCCVLHTHNLILSESMCTLNKNSATQTTHNMKKDATMKSILSLMMVTFILFSFTPITQKAYDPSGVWDWEVETDEGTLTGEMTISKEEEEYEVVIESDIYGTMEMEDVTFEKNIMEGTVEVDGDQVEFEWEFDGDTMEGAAYLGEDELAMSAERQK